MRTPRTDRLIADLVDGIIRREGRAFSNRAADRGGPTKFGVTQDTLSGYLRRPVSVDDVRRLDEASARAIYRAMFLIQPGFMKIPHDGVMLQLVDFGVHSSPARATRFLQRILGVTQDGVLGPKTLDALAAANQDEVEAKLWDDRLVYLASLVRDDRRPVGQNNAQNIVGWVNRMLAIKPRGNR